MPSFVHIVSVILIPNQGKVLCYIILNLTIVNINYVFLNLIINLEPREYNFRTVVTYDWNVAALGKICFPNSYIKQKTIML